MMDELELSEKDMRLFNSKLGLKYLMRTKEVNIKRTLKKVIYESRLRKMQIEMIKMQKWIQANNKRVIVIFEGRDMAGKSGAIRRMTEHLNPREY
ncbi:MAG TPA: polyphosphate kinase 2, partial [Flavobacteriales bacterium]|nr:polyphosphate kinase 2 [Flavobacteriales bacterium]